MGIGLAIYRTIIEAHGGRVWATPNATRGVVFQISLPCARLNFSKASPVDDPSVRKIRNLS
jgi:signal transduction histidine kinase